MQGSAGIAGAYGGVHGGVVGCVSDGSSGLQGCAGVCRLVQVGAGRCWKTTCSAIDFSDFASGVHPERNGAKPPARCSTLTSTSSINNNPSAGATGPPFPSCELAGRPVALEMASGGFAGDGGFVLELAPAMLPLAEPAVDSVMRPASATVEWDAM